MNSKNAKKKPLVILWVFLMIFIKVATHPARYLRITPSTTVRFLLMMIKYGCRDGSWHRQIFTFIKALRRFLSQTKHFGDKEPIILTPATPIREGRKINLEDIKDYFKGLYNDAHDKEIASVSMKLAIFLSLMISSNLKICPLWSWHSACLTKVVMFSIIPWRHSHAWFVFCLSGCAKILPRMLQTTQSDFYHG